MPQANATTALALAVVIAGSFNVFNDDIVPQPTAAVVESGVQNGERALQTPVLKQWEFTEELPGLPQPLDHDYHWSAPPLIAAAPAQVRYFWGDDEIVTAAASIGVDDAYWHAPAPELVPPVVRYFWFNDEITQAPTSSAYDEAGWGGQRKRNVPELKLWDVADDVPQPATPIGVDEAYWAAPAAELVRPVVRHFWFNDEITQAPTSSAYDEAGWGAQRKLNVPELKLWEFTDDLPQASVPVQEDAFVVAAIGSDPLPMVFAADDEIVPAAAPLSIVEPEWQVYSPAWLAAQPLYLPDPEQAVPTAAAPLAITEPEWQVYTPAWLAAQPLYLPDPEQAVPTPPAPLAITEPEWQVYSPAWLAPQPLYLPDPEQAVPASLSIVEPEWQVYTPAWLAAQPLYLPDPEQAVPKSLLIDEMYWAVYTPPLVPKVARVWYSEDEYGSFIEAPIYGWGARGRIGRTNAIDPWSRIGTEQAVDRNVSIGTDTAVDPSTKIGSDSA